MSRLIAALAVALAATTLPLTMALACTCGFAGHEKAVAAADVAFIGTVVDQREPVDITTGMEPARYAFDVELSNVELPNPYAIDATFGGDANCGFDMTIGEEWLVIASEWEGRLQTDSCAGTTLTAALDPGVLNRVKGELSPNDPAAVADPGFTLDVPAPVIGMLAAMVLIGAAGVLAFRRGRST